MIVYTVTMHITYLVLFIRKCLPFAFFLGYPVSIELILTSLKNMFRIESMIYLEMKLLIFGIFMYKCFYNVREAIIFT